MCAWSRQRDEDGESQGPPAVPGAHVAGLTSDGRCPGCNAEVPGEAAFCPRCSRQVADLCAGCGRALRPGWESCAFCGTSAAIAAVLPCPRCGELSWPTHAWCTECGAQVRNRCLTCGTVLLSDWDYCAACGATTGADDRLSGGELGPGVTVQLQTGGMEADGAARVEAEGLNAAGAEAYADERIDEAISLFKRAIVRSPDVASYHTNLGVAYGEKGMDLEAYAAYRQALEMDPRDLQARLNLGYLYSERERYEQAREEWERVIELAPDSEEAQDARDNLNHLEEL